MSSRQKRLAAVIDTAADLNAQFTELTTRPSQESTTIGAEIAADISQDKRTHV